jgi:hypothetical protein
VLLKNIDMQTVVLKSNSKSELKLLTDLAQRIGVQVKYLSESELEDMGMLNAIKKGRTKEYVDTDDFLSELETTG